MGNINWVIIIKWVYTIILTPTKSVTLPNPLKQTSYGQLNTLEAVQRILGNMQLTAIDLSEKFTHRLIQWHLQL